MSKFYVMVFRTSLSPNPLIDLIMVYVYILGKHFTQYHPYPLHDLRVKAMDLDFFMLKFYIIVFRSSVFQKPCEGFGLYLLVV